MDKTNEKLEFQSMEKKLNELDGIFVKQKMDLK